jgi:hypothetical protein
MQKQMQMQQQQQQQQQQRVEPAWREEWDSLTSQLYNSHIDFVTCFWRCMREL